MSEDKFIKKAKDALQDSVDNLDAATLSKLNQARQQAISQLDKPKRARRFNWAPVTGLAAAMVLTSVFMFRSQEIINTVDNGVDEMEIIASNNNLELYEELDFYLWLLEEQPSAG